MTTIAKLAAGTLFEVEDTPGAGTYTEAVEPIGIGATGSNGEFVDVTPISATVREYIGGMRTPPARELQFNWDPSDAGQDILRAAADAGNTVKCRVTFPTATPEVATFDMALSGWVVDPPEADQPLRMTVSGQQAGIATWA